MWQRASVVSCPVSPVRSTVTGFLLLLLFLAARGINTTHSQSPQKKKSLHSKWFLTKSSGLLAECARTIIVSLHFFHVTLVYTGCVCGVRETTAHEIPFGRRQPPVASSSRIGGALIAIPRVRTHVVHVVFIASGAFLLLPIIPLDSSVELKPQQRQPPLQQLRQRQPQLPPTLNARARTHTHAKTRAQSIRKSACALPRDHLLLLLLLMLLLRTAAEE